MSDTTFQQLAIGAGGQLSGLSISNDGTTRLVRTDTYGAYRWDSAASKWKQVVTQSGMPAPYNDVAYGEGVYEICVAPNTATRIYMMYAGQVFRSDDRGTTWTLTTFSSAPSAGPNLTAYKTFGRFMAVDPANADVCYAGTPTDGIWVTTNAGVIWTAVSGIAAPVVQTFNGAQTLGGYTIAFDPASGTTGGKTNTIYITSWGNGSYRSTNAGASFSALSGGPQAVQHTIVAGGVFWATGDSGIFNSLPGALPTSASTAAGNNVLHFTLVPAWVSVGLDISNQTSPSVIPAGTTVTSFNSTTITMSANATGAGVGSGDVFVIGNQNLWKFASGAWTNVQVTGAGQGCHSITIDPANPLRIILSGDGIALLNESLDGGANWLGQWTLGTPTGSSTRVATDIPWLAWTLEDFMGNGDVQFDLDPANPNTLIFAEGIGVWTINPPSTFTGWNVTSQSVGIEQLVSNWCVSPPSGKPLCAFWDRPVFRVDSPTTYPSVHGIGRTVNIMSGWSVDYAKDDPSFIAVLCAGTGQDQSGFSTDGGQTWSPFAGGSPWFTTDQRYGGHLAVSTHLNMVCAVSNNGDPYYTLDGGATWNRISISGVPQIPLVTGWGAAYFQNRHIVEADPVTANKFYMVNAGSANAPTTDGLYTSTDGGVTWSYTYTQNISAGNTNGGRAQLRGVPGNAGHLIWTPGQLTGRGGVFPGDLPLRYSVNSGGSWDDIVGVKEVFGFGFGKIAPGNDYPTVFIAGWVNGVWGIWRSTSSAATWATHSPTWTQLGQWPDDIFDTVQCVNGDMNKYGTVYVGFGGSGFSVGSLINSVSGTKSWLGQF